MANAVRDPLLPLTHYQKIGKQSAKEKNYVVIWLTIIAILALIGTGIFFLHREIEALNKETEMPQPLIEQSTEPEVTQTPLSPAVTKVQATPTPSIIPTMPIQSTVAPTESAICTLEATQCPDGSWVGRSGPNCEFKCPTP